MPLGDLRAELTLLARMGLDELERERQLFRIVMREEAAVPELADASTRRSSPRDRIAVDTLERYAAERGSRAARPRGHRRGRLTDALVGLPAAGDLFGKRLAGSTRERLPRPGSNRPATICNQAKGAKMNA